MSLLAALVIVWACSTSLLSFDRARRRAEDELHKQRANAIWAASSKPARWPSAR